MAICAIQNSLGGIEATSTSIGSCTDLVILTAQDFSAFTPMYTPGDAALVASAVAAVWAIAWGFRALGFSAR